MAQVSVARVRARVRSTSRLVPGLCAVTAMVLAVGIVGIDQRIGDFRSMFLFPGAEGAAASLARSPRR